MFLLVTAIAPATATAATLCAGPLRVLRVVLQSATTYPGAGQVEGCACPDERLWTPGFQSIGEALLADLVCCSFPGAAGAGALDNWILDV